MKQDLLSSVDKLGVVDVVAIDQMVMCGMIRALACSFASWYSMFATEGLETSSP
jgi:hypothetical protein